MAFIDKNTNNEKRKFLLAELNYLESYLRQVVEYAQIGEHKKNLEKIDAEMIATHTYLVISEILKLMSNKDRPSN